MTDPRKSNPLPALFLSAFFAGLLLLTLFALQPTDSDIKACMDTTSYSYARCEFELGK